MQALGSYYDIISESSGMYLSEAECSALQKFYLRSAQAYMWMRQSTLLLFGETGMSLKRWKPRPKAHQWYFAAFCDTS